MCEYVSKANGRLDTLTFLLFTLLLRNIIVLPRSNIL